MKIRKSRALRRTLSVGAAGILMAALAACTGRGGGILPPGPNTASALWSDAVFTNQALFGFDFSCQDAGGINPPAGKLQIQLDYTDRGRSALLRAPFSVHGIVDQIDPVLESEVCSGQQPSTPPGQLTFLGRYRPTTSTPPGFPSTCPARETSTKPLCRFEVTVQDNDRNMAPSAGDFFSIQLSSATALTSPSLSQLPAGTVFYARAGYLEGGNITVK
jgi:hypothetical protein